jgi:hypothetical protein
MTMRKAAVILVMALVLGACAPAATPLPTPQNYAQEIVSVLNFCKAGLDSLTPRVIAVSTDESLVYDTTWKMAVQRTLYTLDDCVTKINSLPDPPAAYTTSDIYLRGAATELSGMTADFRSLLDNPTNDLIEKVADHMQKFNLAMSQSINARPK